MRKLVYVGYNKKEDIGIETTNYDLMNEYRTKGFVFTTRLDEIKKEETKKQKEERLARIAKRNNKRKN